MRTIREIIRTKAGRSGQAAFILLAALSTASKPFFMQSPGVMAFAITTMA